MLSGNETGWLLGDYLLSTLPAEQHADAVVATTVVSSRMLAAIAAHYGAHHVETLTGFKWLARADADLPGAHLRYAYEEAIGHCVDPEAVRDKDGIGTAVLICDLVAALRAAGTSIPRRLDELAQRHGVHVGAAVTRRVGDIAEASAVMRRLRATPPDRIAGMAVEMVDLADHRDRWRTDALIFTGGADGAEVRVVVRPSGTEPKLKCYIEVRAPVVDRLSAARNHGEQVRDAVVDEVGRW